MQTFRRDWIRFGRNEKKNSLIKQSSSTQDFRPFFQTLSLFSRRFPRLENYWADFKTLSRIQDSVRTPMGALLFGCVVSLVVRNLCLGNYRGDPRL